RETREDGVSSDVWTVMVDWPLDRGTVEAVAVAARRAARACGGRSWDRPVAGVVTEWADYARRGGKGPRRPDHLRGECWTSDVAVVWVDADGPAPLYTLVHEMVHAVVGATVDHGLSWKRPAAMALGMAGVLVPGTRTPRATAEWLVARYPDPPSELARAGGREALVAGLEALWRRGAGDPA